MVAIAALSLGAQTRAGPGVAALVVGAVQTLPVLWRRERPIAALVVYAASVVPAALIVGSALTLYTWAVLLFAVVRRSRPLPGGRGGGGAPTWSSRCWWASSSSRTRWTRRSASRSGSRCPCSRCSSSPGPSGSWPACVRSDSGPSGAATSATGSRTPSPSSASGSPGTCVASSPSASSTSSRGPGRWRAPTSPTPNLRPRPRRRLTATAGEARAALAGMRRALGLLRDEPAGAVPGPVATACRRAGDVGLPSRGGLVLAGILGAVVALVAVLAAAAAPHLEPGAAADFVGTLDVDPGRPLALLPLVVQVLSVAWWRRAPLPALVVATAGSCAASALGSTHLVTEGAWSILVYGAGLGAGLVPSAVTVAGCTAVVLATTLTIADLPASLTASRASWALSYALVPAIWGLGVFHRRHAQAEARHTEAREAASAERAVRSQRLGLARELHDVLAHELSALVVTLHAARVAPSAEALTAIGEAGERIASALPPLLAGAGRARVPRPATTPASTPPRWRRSPPRCATPDARDRRGRGDRPGRTGPRPTCSPPGSSPRRSPTPCGTPAPPPPPPPTRVTVRHDEDAVAVEVVDAGVRPGHRGSREGSGLGLVGMRERAALVGGSVDAGPAGDGWRVAARLPRRAAGLLLEEEGTVRDPPIAADDHRAGRSLASSTSGPAHGPSLRRRRRVDDIHT